MPAQMTYAIRFVADMDQSVRFYRDTLGLALKFQSPQWSEFATGQTTLALHPASPQNPAGKVQLGFRVSDLQAFYAELSSQGVIFSRPPELEGNSIVARFLDTEGIECSVSEG
jgi:catechol 2,3-dioxygenase-like lactoylglutathione lyase family enzyme